MAAPSLENVVNVVNTWIYRALVLSSLAAHLIIVFFSKTRRRERYSFWRLMVWMAYQVTNWVPPYVLSNLYLGDIYKPPPPPQPQPRLVAFWMSFLLLHLARSDSMGAYSENDHATKLRTMVLVGLQSMGAFFVLCRYIMVDYCTAGTLGPAACIMFFLGIYRYVESAVALRLSDLSKIRSESEESVDLHDYYMMDQQGGSAAGDDDEDALLLAHAMFCICKSAFTDSRVKFDGAEVGKILLSGRDGGKNMMRKVVEMELSLMYDVMYTKAAVVHTWCGYAVRVASPVLTATALLLFRVRYQEYVCSGFDVWISYILLWTTLALDVRCLVRALVSTWTLSFLIKAKPRHQLLYLGRWKKLRSLVMCLVRLLTIDKKHQGSRSSSYRRWSCNIGQHNLLRESSKARRWWWQEVVVKNPVLEHEIADRLVDLLCKNICNKLFFQLVEHPGQQQLPTVQHVPVSRKKTVQHVLEPCRRPITQQQDCYVGTCPCPCPCPCPGPGPGGEQDVNASSGPDPGPGPGQQTVLERDAEEETGLIPKFGEVVLTWHITTDVFLYRHGDREDMRESQSEEAKAIKAISDYMLFLAAVRPRMLPGVQARSLYETARDDLTLMRRRKSKDGRSVKTDKELAGWMLNDNATTNNPILSRGIRDAHSLQGLLTRDDWKAPLKSDRGGKMPMVRAAYMTRRIADFELRNHSKVDMQNLLSFMLDEWVHLLLYASTQCGSRESHANQLSRGGELTTILWIIKHHATTNLVRHQSPPS